MPGGGGGGGQDASAPAWPRCEETSVAAAPLLHTPLPPPRPLTIRIPIRVPPAHRIRLSPPRRCYYSRQFASPSVGVRARWSSFTVTFFLPFVPTFDPLSVFYFYFGKCVLINSLYNTSSARPSVFVDLRVPSTVASRIISHFNIFPCVSKKTGYRRRKNRVSSTNGH